MGDSVASVFGNRAEKSARKFMQGRGRTEATGAVTGKGAKPPFNRLVTEASRDFQFHACHFLAQLLCRGGCVSLRSLHALVPSGLGLSIHPPIPL